MKTNYFKPLLSLFQGFVIKIEHSESVLLLPSPLSRIERATFYKMFFLGALFFQFSSASIQAQTCDCNEYLYLNEVTNGGKVHKYQVNPNGTITEVNPTGPWYPNGGVSELSSPHGLGMDLNGNIYIAERWQPDNSIRRLDCEGNLASTADFEIQNAGTFNITSIENTIYANTSGSLNVSAYNACDGSFVNDVCFNGLASSISESMDWGLFYDKNTEYFYSSFPQDHADGGGINVGAQVIYRYRASDFGTGVCVEPFISYDDGTVNVGDNELPNINMSGITTDADGNIYIVATGYLEPGQLMKYDAAGNYISSSLIDAVNGDGGYYAARAIVYSTTSDRLYVSTQVNSTTEDCISIFDKDLNYLGAAAFGNGDTGQGQSGFLSGKAMAIGIECCPTFETAEVNESLCSQSVGEQYFLTNFLPCEFVCSGTWTVDSNTAGIYDACDNSFTYQQAGTSCFSYDYVPTGANANELCEEFHIDVCITFEDPSATLTPNLGTCTGNSANNDASISITGVTNGDEANYSTGATYSGPAYGDATGIDISGGSGSITGLAHNTQYTVRIYNGSDECYIDETITTPSIDCDGGCPVLNCSDVIIDGDTKTAESSTCPGFNFFDYSGFNDIETFAELQAEDLDPDPNRDSIRQVLMNVDGSGVDLTLTVAGDHFATAGVPGPNVYSDNTDSECLDVMRVIAGRDTTTVVLSYSEPVPICNFFLGGHFFRESPDRIVFSRLVAYSGPNGTGTPVLPNYSDPNDGFSDFRNVTMLNQSTGEFTIHPDPSLCTDEPTPLFGDPTFDCESDASNRGRTNFSFNGAMVQSFVWKAYDVLISDGSFVATQTSQWLGSCNAAGENICFIDTITICDDGSTSTILEAPANLTNVIWYDSFGFQLMTGATLMVNSNTSGMSDGQEAFYFEAQDGNGCDVKLCCPVLVLIESCDTCIDPTATFNPSASTCTADVENNDGRITWMSDTDATHYGVSSANAGAYDGPLTIVGATSAPANGTDILTDASHVGASYIVRVFNGADDCYVDVTVSVPAGPICVAPIFDLALEKVLSASNTGPFVPGEEVTFTIEVSNQGDVDAYNIELKDYFIVGELVLADSDWTVLSSGVAQLNNDINFIGAGEMESVNITFIIDEDFQGETIINYAEISEADDDNNPGNGFPTDADSTPDDNQGDDELADDGEIVDSDNGNLQDDDADSDDYDPAPIVVVQEFDLAIQKTYTSWDDTNMDGMISNGEDVTFTVVVYNQGTLDATGVEVTDYVPTGLTHPSGATVVTVVGAIAKGASATYDIVMTVDPMFMGGLITNNTEITAGTNALDLEDEDNPLGIIHGSADDESEVDTDNDIDDEAPGTPGTMDNPDDVDDYDPAPIMIGQTFDLAIDKVINTTATPGPYTPDGLVTFTVTVYNQGTVDATAIIIEDYLPTGTTFESSPDFSLQGAEYLANIMTLDAGASQVLEITVRIDDDFMGSSIVNNVEIVSAQNALGLTDQDNDLVDVTGLSDDGSELDTDNDTDDEAPGTPGSIDNIDDIDDYDPAFVPVTQRFDLALDKTFNSSSTTLIRPGSEVTFTIEVTNQGTLDAFNINVVDYIPAGLTLADSDWTELTPGKAYLNNDITYIARGEMESVNITFTVDADFMGTEIINWAEINEADDNNDPNDGFPIDDDSTPNDDQFSENGETDDLDDDGEINEDGKNGEDEDDHDPAQIEVVQSFDVALQKVISSWDDTDMNGMIDQGENVTFTVTVYNQGNLDAIDVEVTDYVPTGMIFNAADNSDFTGGPLTPTATVASLPMGGHEDLTIVLQVDPMYMGTMVINNAEITSATNALGQDDEDNPLDVVHGSQNDGSELDTDNDTDDEFPGTPGTADNVDDVDDYDPVMIMIGQVFDLALFKVYDSYNDLNGDSELSPGDEVTFLITVINQGSLDAYNIQISDYIPDGLTLADSDWNNTQNVTIGQLNTVHPYLEAGDQTTRTITFTIDELWRGTSIVNWAEISAADDNDNPADGFPMDEDSTPDSIDDNDTFGGDNIVDNTNNDEDDHDPAEINPVIRFDLALAKKDQSDDPVSAFGEVRTFDIEVTNQGTVNATEFTVVDYIPCGMEFVGGPGNNPGWTYNSITRMAEFIYDDSVLTPTNTVTLTIDLAIINCDEGTGYEWINYAEISDYDDDYNDFNADLPEHDSDPDETNFDDAGGVAWTPSDDFIDGDGTGPLNSGPAANDEDDHDPEKVEVFDLALSKVISSSTPGPYSYYDNVTFDIEVTNQGNIGAQDIEVTDYIPDGYAFNLGDNFGWSGSAPSPTYLIEGPIASNTSITISITLQIVQTDGGEKDWINYAEITAADNENGEDRTDWDIDSNPGSDNVDENNVEPGDLADNDIDSTDKGGEEDDHDPAGIEIYDLAQRKTTLDEGPFAYGDEVLFTIEVFNQGSIESSSIEITDYLPCGLKYLSSNDANGWSYDASTGNATVTLPGTLVPGESTTIDITLEVTQCLDISAYSFTNYTEISNSESEDPDEEPEDIDSEEDDDPENDGDPIDDEVEDPNDEDDHDPERIEVFDLALRKILNSPTAAGDCSLGLLTGAFGNGTTGFHGVSNGLPAYEYGTIGTELNYDLSGVLSHTKQVSFEIKNNLDIEYQIASAENLVINTTGTPGEISIDVLGDNVIVDIGAINELTYTHSYTDLGSSYEMNYEITDLAGTVLLSGSHSVNSISSTLNHYVIEYINSLTGPYSSRVNGSKESLLVGDDCALANESNTEPLNYGDELKFTIQVFNQGNVVADNIEVTDYLPAGYSVSNNPLNSIWTVNGSNYTTVLPDALAPDDYTTVDIYLTVERTGGGEKEWINYAEITEATDENGDPVEDADSEEGSDNADENDVEPEDPEDDDIESTDKGGEEDDHDPAGIEVYDLAQRKTTNETGPFRYGDDIIFTIEVFNQGSIESSNIEVTDYIPCGFEYLSSNDALGWAYDAVTGNATIVLTDDLVPGESTTVDITLKVKQCLDDSELTFTNFTEISDSESNDPDEDPEDIDSDEDDDPNNDGDPTDDEIEGDPNDPTNPDEDDHDPEEVAVFDLALRKELITPAPYKYGNLLEFKITVCNQGNVTGANIVIEDYLPVGYTFDFANNPGWGGTVADPTYTIQGVLVEDACTYFSMFATLEMTSGGEKNWINYAEIIEATDENGGTVVDADSNPGTDSVVENDVEPGDDADNDMESTDLGGEEDDHDPAGPEIYDLAQRKTTLNKGPFAYGEEVVFTIEVFNQGSIESSNIEVTDYLPCGLKYVSSNDFNGWNYDASSDKVQVVLSGNLAPGSSTSIDIILQVAPCYGSEVSKSWTNYTEISDSESEEPGDPNGDPDDPDDIDSEEDEDPENDGDPKDDEINDPDDEDDHDLEELGVFDLALIKYINNKGPYSEGEVATFEFEVTNQGNVAAYNVVVTDYVRNGYIFDALMNVSWLTNGSNLQYTIAGPIAPGEVAKFKIALIVAIPENANVNSWYNEAEISAADDDTNPDNEDPVDADSTPDIDPDNDNDLVDGPDDDPIFDEEDDNDNVIDEDPNDPFGNGDDDEDDNDAAGILVVGGLGDTVWKDIDGDGIQDLNEPGVEGVTAILSDCDGNMLGMLETDENGFYFFDNLIPGDYQVRFDISNLEEGCAFTYQDQGNDDALDSDVDLSGFAPCTTIQGGEYDSTFDAGLLILSSLGDYVWHDLDGDGIQESGEPGIGGVTVNLYNIDSELIGTTVTDGNGYYLFDNLYPDTYFVEFIDPIDFLPTFADQGSNDNLDSDVSNAIIIPGGGSTTGLYVLRPGEHNPTIDAGYYMCIPIGETVWYDVDTDDIEDATENGINGLLVTLWRLENGSWVEWDYMFTGHKPGTGSDDGYYKFCAPPGTYHLAFDLPPTGLVLAQPNVGGDDNIDSDVTNANGFGTTNSYTVLSGEEICTIGAGFYPMAEVGSFVWNDANRNGIQESNESPLEGVTVQAYDMGNNMINEVETNADGEYNMDYLQQESYYLKFTPPSGYGATIANVGSDDKDSDITHTYGYNTTQAYAMSSGEKIENVDAGLSLGVLPVEWLYVRASNREDHNLVSWATTLEINSDYYSVERRLGNEEDFKSIGRVAGKGNSSNRSEYNFKDEDVSQSGIYYYRIKQVDLDGSVVYSDRIIVSIEGREETTIRIYPNPATNTAMIQVNGAGAEDANVMIFNKEGKLIRSGLTLEEGTGSNYELRLDVNSYLPGVYTVKIETATETWTEKLIIIR